MLKYYNYLIGLQEVPDEISLVVNIANCRLRCPDCHAKMLWKDEGERLNPASLIKLVKPFACDVTCVCLMGGDVAPDEINTLAESICVAYPGLRVAWYSGRDTLPVFIELKNFDYIKLGPYVKERGGLSTPGTNQRFFRVVGGELHDMTNRFLR